MNPVIPDIYSLSNQLKISLPAEDSFPHDIQSIQVERLLAAAFFTQVKEKYGCLVLDEAQRNIRLIEFLVKSNEGRAFLIISGTPPHGAEAIDYGGSAHSRCGKFTLPSLRTYEVLALLKALFVNDITVKAWLDFWALFNGEPHLYRLFEKNVVNQLDENIKKRIAVEGLYDEWILEKCSQILKTYSDTGISKELREEIGGSTSRNRVQQSIQKSVQQLLERGILGSVVKVSDFLSLSNPKSSTIIWNDSFIELDIKCNHPTSLRMFKSRRGLGLEDLFKNIVAWHVWSSDLESVISLNCSRLDICTLSYEGGTDADLLLIERAPIDPDLSEVPSCLKAFIFNIKTNSESFIGKDGLESKKKFRALCSKFAEKYQLTLCLACREIEENQGDEILQFWKDVESDGYSLLNKVVTLDDFLEKAPDILNPQ